MGKSADVLECMGYITYARTGDIYCLFYELGMNLLTPNGFLCYITSNKWMRAGYGEALRGYFASKTNPIMLVDFAGIKIFDAITVEANILLSQKAANIFNTQACLVQDSNGLNNLSDFVQQQGVKCNFADSIPWVILSPIEQSIKQKIESVGIPLKDWNIQINYGIKTGFNDAFIISTEKRDEILANCQTEDERVRTAELIRPILRGRDIKRYGYDWAGQWLIYIPWHFPYQFDESITGASEKAEKAFKEQYPAVYNHMLEYKEPLSKRNKAETGIRYEWYAMQRWGAKYWEDFSKPKIIWGEISDKSKFAFDFLGEYIPEATSFYMKGECIEYLLSALNSSVSEWLFSKVGTTTGVGTIRWKKYTIEQLIVAKLSTEQLNTHLAAFNDLKVGKMSITDFECFSNKLMYDVYKLTSDEIQYIENQQIV